MNATRVLVIEDDAPLRRTIVDLLTSWGHEVKTASDGRDAWEKLPNFDPLVVISDLNPPRMLTPDLVQAVRRGVPDVSCLILTDSPNCPEAVEAIRYGARAVIEKPPDAKRLKAHLEACLRCAPLMQAGSPGRLHVQQIVGAIWREPGSVYDGQLAVLERACHFGQTQQPFRHPMTRRQRAAGQD